ncbi:MAG TPA: AAA family ATPase [Rhodanobacteraceae bacterium]|nr:AAA family ATPase [Rhodanobacteraceae bacterium]
MSIVEKAAEKLKNLQPGELPPPQDADAAVPPVASTLERAHERMQEAKPADADAATPPWHVDMKRLKRAGLIPGEVDAARRLGDEVRRVKRPLLNNLGGKRAARFAHAERIVVTSAVPGEGKSFTSLNLALSLAREPDFEVLLIDGDVPKSNITQSLGLEDRPGLMDLLVHKDMQPADVIVRTDVPNFLVVPAGQRHPLTTELFGGRRMEHVLDAWDRPDRQRLLVFDSSPLLATSEAQVLASHMGQVVMIVAAGRTRRQELNTAMQSLSESQYIGFVLNMSRLQASENHYYDSYYSNCYSAISE